MRNHTRRGFSLIECMVLLVVIGLLVVVLAPMLGAARNRMRVMSSAEKLMQIGQGGAMYAQDNVDRLFSYSWAAGEVYIMPSGQARLPSDDREASGLQNQEILIRRSMRLDGAYKILNFARRVPHLRFSHLVLMDYLGQDPGTDAYIDPSDEKLLHWNATPLSYDANSTVPYSRVGVGWDYERDWDASFIRQRWAFSSSYQVVPDAWQGYELGNRYVPQADTPHLIEARGDPDLHSGQSFGRVLHPSNKVWMFEEFDRDRQVAHYFGYDDARVEKLMFDGSVNNWASGDAAPSVVPEFGLFHWRQRYVALHRFPRAVEGGATSSEPLSQRWRWTYGGLSGINYGNFGGGN